MVHRPLLKEAVMPRTVLALVPHPDDAEFFAGGTIAKMVAEGARVLMVVATDGRKGSFEHESEKLAALRAEEVRQAAKVMGIEPPILLGHPDLEVDTLRPGLLREQFIRAIRRYRPEVVIAPDAFDAYEVHPDHRAVAWAASDAVNFATLPLMHPEHRAEGLEPHYVPEKYFYRESADGANKIVDISQTMGKKLAALAEHKSQVAFLVEEVMRQARLAGLDLGALLGEAAQDPMAALTWAMQAQGAEVGAKIGVEYGEAFRYTRFHPLVETLLGASAP
jgi:LmbE family N-acetylglucosaminyl deacetylase